jgi:hypothetical protein
MQKRPFPNTIHTDRAILPEPALDQQFHCTTTNLVADRRRASGPRFYLL